MLTLAKTEDKNMVIVNTFNSTKHSYLINFNKLKHFKPYKSLDQDETHH